MVTFSAQDPLSADFREAIAGAISQFLDSKMSQLADIGSELSMVTELADEFTRSGKRMRPAFCLWGYAAAAGVPDPAHRIVAAAASLDLLHVSALVHDDVMDASDTRRGVPSAHRQMESAHRAREWRGSASAFGQAGSILLGDLLLVWSEEMYSSAGFSPEHVARAAAYWHAVRTEVVCGQFLDITAAAQPLDGEPASQRWAIDEAYRVVEYKTAKYTVQRPLQIGAALGGGSAELLSALEVYGSAVGRAFQFRDDLLGVFGDSSVTGKPAGDDLREGKLTALIGYTLQAVDAPTRRQLNAWLGDAQLTPQQIRQLRDLITESGARTAVEAEISDCAARARDAVASVPMVSPADDALLRLIDLSVARIA